MAVLKFSLPKNGIEKEQTFELADDEIRIGRDPRSHIVLARDGVSRHHASVRKTVDGYLLVDNDSLNGTIYRGRKIHEHLLRHGDVFHIDQVSFRLLVLDEKSAVAPVGTSQPLPGKARSAGGRKRLGGLSCFVWMMAVVVLVLGAAVGLLGVYLVYAWKTASSSSRTAVATIAPELASYGGIATLHGDSRTFTAGPRGAETKLSDGASIRVPKDALVLPARFRGAVIDLDLTQRSPDVLGARVYMIAMETNAGPLSDPVVLEIPVAVSQNVTFARHDGSDWIPFVLPEGPTARIPFHSFSRRYAAVVRWSGKKASAGATAAGSASTAILAVSQEKMVLGFLKQYTEWFQGNDFARVVRLGDLTAVEKALRTDLTIEIKPGLGAMGKYYPRESLWFGSAFGRNHRLQVAGLREDFIALKTLWHEFLHHMIRLRGGEQCGPEETYMELVEDRADWLGRLTTFDRYLRSVRSVDRNACDQLQRRWNMLSSQWESLRGNHLSGPFSWQDPKGATCGVHDKTYTISPEFIKKWDKKLGIDINVDRIRSFYEQKISRLPTSVSAGCRLREVKPPQALKKQKIPSTTPTPPKRTRIRPPSGGKKQPCPVVQSQIKRCPWSPDGFKVDPCPPGYCYDTGPRGSYICVQIKGVPNGRRSYTGRIICNEGFAAVTDRCSGLILECVKSN